MKNRTQTAERPEAKISPFLSLLRNTAKFGFITTFLIQDEGPWSHKLVTPDRIYDSLIVIS